MTGLIDDDRLLDVLETETLLLAASAAGADHDRPVPACPGLTVGETARHLGSVQRMVVSWVRTGRRPVGWEREPGPGADVEDWLRDSLRTLLGELVAHHPDEPCPTWHPGQQDYRFWRRRMAHEATVHRVDVQSAANGGGHDPIPQDVAVDGIDEVLAVWFTQRLAELGVAGTRQATVVVRAAGHTWLAEMGVDRTSAGPVSPLAAETADAVVTAEPALLYLWLWGRSAVFDRAVRREGDMDAVAQLWALLRLATR
ncbi:maleylpyruvate isomerase N-terminal domain-containing protein [Actinokineospora sp. G85]|uniref:maleylpyruvate isomerase N-terminal domain-containing protein n=1 Tax=Actinokineospora sp. G85 TaxID=3406626 RepID=UPI003C710C8C